MNERGQDGPLAGVGQGYVGPSVAVRQAEAGCDVIGLETAAACVFDIRRCLPAAAKVEHL